jgi:hypothetical protein
MDAFHAFAAEIARLDAPAAGSLEDVDVECEPQPVPVRRKR